MKEAKLYETMRITQGTGYFDCTRYPIGGKFCRVPANAKEGLLVLAVKPLIRPYKGVNAKGTTPDGKEVAFDLQYTKENLF